MKRFLSIVSLISAGLALGNVAGLATASAVIVVPTTATQNSVLNDYGLYTPASLTIDGSGLSDPSSVANGAPIPAAWPTNTSDGTTPAAINGYLGWSSENPTVTYTFASPVHLAGGHFWQYGGDSAGRSLKQADLFVLPEGQTVYQYAGKIQPYSQVMGNDPGMDFNFAVDYGNIVGVQFANTIPYDTNQANTFGLIGWGEVRFVTAVPEPGTLLLTASGLVGLLAYAWRKRK
jgi:hypothetical protein